MRHDGKAKDANGEGVCYQELLDRAHKVPLAETTEQLQSLAEWYREDAMRRGRFWVQWFPSIVMVFAAISTCIVYFILVLRPLYDGFLQVAQ